MQPVENHMVIGDPEPRDTGYRDRLVEAEDCKYFKRQFWCEVKNRPCLKGECPVEVR